MKNVYKSFAILMLIIPMLLLAACSGDEESKDKNSVEDNGEKQTIVFADAGWESLRFHNWVARTIIEEGYGYQTDVTSGSTTVTLLGLQEGDINVYMEIWKQNIKDAWEKAVDSGTVKKVSVNFDDNIQGFYVPTYVIEGDPERGIKPMAPDLKTTKDLLEYADVFDGKLYGSPLGWKAEEISQQQMEKYGLKDKFKYIQPGSGASLKQSMVQHYEKGEPWVGYMWGPTWMLGMYDMTYLEGTFPQNDVLVAINKDLEDTAPKVVEFLSNYQTSADITNAVLSDMKKNEIEAKDEAKKWLKKNPDIWTKWVPDDVAKKVKDSL
ncbi:ABC transporter substrate-binding protein [Virgibacillus siamensis]|uniref:ABC transporter substrate-binding protein n=1 Tax=Virgibacillus siamensis TaxID=480071 RepID=UPI000984E465|nr:ABC transporter substrate-binding protein [Virgibacillus siamensis]